MVKDETQALAGALSGLIQGIDPDHAQADGCEKFRIKVEAITNADKLDFAELLDAEKGLLQFLKEDVLRRSAWLTRERFRLLVGETGFKKYIASDPPDPATAPRPLLEADLICLLNQIHSSYLFNVAKEKQIGSLKRWLVSTAGLLSALAIAGAVLRPDGAWLIWIIMASGTAGALMSILRRLQAVGRLSVFEQDPILELSSLTYGKTGIFVALFSGAAFSLLLYCLFASGLVGNATFFPAFSQEGTPAKSGVDLMFFVDNVGPAHFADYAKIVVWSFIAGFAERFVPDVLDRLVNRGNTAEPKPK